MIASAVSLFFRASGRCLDTCKISLHTSRLGVCHTFSIPVMEFWTALVLLWSFMHSGQAVDCYTCNVDFRSEPYKANNTCLFPRDTKKRTSCSSESKYCQGIITRINGVFVQLQRTCEVDCQELCTEKGFGIETSECRFCCNDSIKNNAECGFQGYKNNAYLTEQFFGWFGIYLILWIVCDYINFDGDRFTLNPVISV